MIQNIIGSNQYIFNAGYYNITIIMKKLMQGTASLLVTVFSLLLIQDVHGLGNPGLSMSADVSIISQFKDKYLPSMLKQVNGQSLPNIPLGADGHINNNKVYIKLRTNDVVLEANSEKNAYIVQIKDIYLFMRSQDFRYNLWFVPVKATLDVEVQKVRLDFQIELQNRTIEYTDPKTGYKENRTLPYINVLKSELTFDPKMMNFNIGGSILARVVDIIIPMFTRIIKLIIETKVREIVQQDMPTKFNAFIMNTKGFYPVGNFLPNHAWENTTFDFQLETMNIEGHQRLDIAFNGTFFDSFSTGWRTLPGILQPKSMPYYDPKLNSTWQVFISTYLLEHFSRTTLDEAPYVIPLEWNFLKDKPEFWMTTSSTEAFFPFLTLHHGENIPVDMHAKITKVWDFNSKSSHNKLTFKINIEGDAYLHRPLQEKLLIGKLEFYEAEVQVGIKLDGLRIVGKINIIDFQTAYTTCYFGDYQNRYESTPFLINIIKFGSIIGLNDMFVEKNIMVPSEMSFFSFQDIHFGYYDDYIAFGITPKLKNPPPTPVPVPQNKTVLLQPNGDAVSDEAGQSSTMPSALTDSELGTCDWNGRCRYISEIIDELEQETVKGQTV